MSLIYLLRNSMPLVARKTVDWTKRIKEEEEEGPGLWFACVNAPSEVTSSSHLKSQGSKSYESGNLSDWDPRTAWVEGKSGYGIGEFFENQV
jgi:hypothetical protein